MKNSIPDQFLFECELYKNIERRAIKHYGDASQDALEFLVKSEIKTESNSILLDLYRQMLVQLKQANHGSLR
ncbi:hypothetical protein ACXNAM_06890 [Kluyvera cryocrescens]|nr:hypothetical protein [Kluyvera cryocrescens]HEP1899063.1 hypothetical protein [Kluyvera cryocrescens]